MSHSKPTQTNAEDEREVRVPEPEVLPGAKRRRFSVEYKQHILEEGDACTQRGQIGQGKRRDLHTKAGWGRIRRHPSGQVKWVFFMMIKEIQAKVLVSHVKQPDPWFGLKYNMNLYRGCQHQCIYCDSRSECYQIEDFNHDVLIKANAIDLLRKELARKRVKGTIGTGSMNDPYMPLEEEVNLTRRALEIIAQFRFPVHIVTKSDLVLRDLDTLIEINKVYATVSFTVTTADDELGKKLEPGAPLVSGRFRAMQVLADHGIRTGVTLMPILPFIEDTEENITAIVEAAHKHGATYLIPWFGMSLRDKQRAYYYAQLDKLFPGLRRRYERTYGDRYDCPVPNADRIAKLFHELCNRHGIATRITPYEPETATQLSLF